MSLNAGTLSSTRFSVNFFTLYYWQLQSATARTRETTLTNSMCLRSHRVCHLQCTFFLPTSLSCKGSAPKWARHCCSTLWRRTEQTPLPFPLRCGGWGSWRRFFQGLVLDLFPTTGCKVLSAEFQGILAFCHCVNNGLPRSIGERRRLTNKTGLLAGSDGLVLGMH